MTASPVLTNEVRRYYKTLIETVRQGLLKKKERLEKEYDLLNEDEEAKDTMRKIEEFLSKEEEELLDEIEVENQLNLPNSLNELNNSHFPLFLTVKRLVYMIDACLTYPFFVRNNSNEIVGMDGSV